MCTCVEMTDSINVIQWSNDTGEWRKKQLDLDTLEEIHLLSLQIGTVRDVHSFFMYYQIHIHETTCT